MPDVHVAVAFAGTVHGVQLEPHVATAVFETHEPPQLWNPVLQVVPQLVPSQVAVPVVLPRQAVQLDPQLAMAVFDTQVPPQL